MRKIHTYFGTTDVLLGVRQNNAPVNCLGKIVCGRIARELCREPRIGLFAQVRLRRVSVESGTTFVLLFFFQGQTRESRVCRRNSTELQQYTIKKKRIVLSPSAHVLVQSPAAGGCALPVQRLSPDHGHSLYYSARRPRLRVYASYLFSPRRFQNFQSLIDAMARTCVHCRKTF